MHLVLKICPNVCFYAYLDLTQNPSYNYQSLFKLKSREWWRSFINESFPPWCLWSVFIYQIRWQLLHCLSYRGCGCGHYVMKFPPVPFQLLDIIPNQPVYSDPEVAEALGCTVHSNCLTWSIRHQLIPASQEKLAYPPSDMKQVRI